MCSMCKGEGQLKQLPKWNHVALNDSEVRCMKMDERSVWDALYLEYTMNRLSVG